MLIGGLQKTTLIDFPGRVGCTIFTVGCNFRCPFCHNKDLITQGLFKKSGIELLKEADFFQFLKARKKILDGVCITGGEPTLQPDLKKFCRKIKNLGLEIKLDSNGSNPQILKEFIKEKLVDYIAMDIKTIFSEYSKAIGNNYPSAKIEESVAIILKSDLEYELRTTMVPGIHDKKIMVQLAKELASKNKLFNKRHQPLNYFLQLFRPKNCLDSAYLKKKPFSHQKGEEILKAVQKFLTATQLRGE